MSVRPMTCASSCKLLLYVTGCSKLIKANPGTSALTFVLILRSEVLVQFCGPPIEVTDQPILTWLFAVISVAAPRQVEFVYPAALAPALYPIKVFNELWLKSFPAFHPMAVLPCATVV